MQLAEKLSKLYTLKINWKIKQFYFIAYFFFYMLGGAMHNPLFAFIIAGFYEIGFVGLMYFFKAAHLRSWFHLAVGVMLGLVSFTWLEVLFFF